MDIWAGLCGFEVSSFSNLGNPGTHLSRQGTEIVHSRYRNNWLVLAASSYAGPVPVLIFGELYELLLTGFRRDQ